MVRSTRYNTILGFPRLLWFAVFFFSSLVSQAAQLYWIGTQQGSWNDGNNWSFEKNGDPAHVIPGAYDDVHFYQHQDQLHFQVITGSDIEIRSLHVEPGIILSSENTSAVSVHIYQNLKNEGDIRFPVTTTWIFEKTSIQQEFYSATFIQGNVHVNGGNVFMQSDLYCSNLHVTRGNLSTNAHHIAADEIAVYSHGEITGSGSMILYKHPLDDELINQLKLQNNQLIEKQSLNPCGTIPFTLTAVVTTNYNGWNTSCNGAEDATICVNVVGGVGPFTYVWIGGGPTTPCWSGRGAGNYLVVVFDQGQGGTPCNTSIVVNEPTPLTLFSWTGNNPSCFGSCDGTATPVIIGGQPPYTYNWSTGETTPTATLLCVGQNTCTITDANGCSFDTTFFILTPTPVAPNVTVTNATCFGVCDGAADSNPSGGNGAPYTYLWTPGNSISDQISGLCVGAYSVTVTDNNGCTGVQNVNITQPVSIVVNLTSQTNLVCNGVCSGSLTVSAANGTMPYTYQWYNATTGVPIAGETNPTISNLCAGSYYVIANDAGTCFGQSPTYIISQPSPIVANASSANATCNNVCNGVLSVSLSGGTPGYTATWINAVTTATIGSGTPLNNVCDGTYFAEIQDANGCLVNTNVVVITEPPAITLTVTDTDVNCFGLCNGTATANPGGGTPGLTVTWHNSPSGTQVGAAGNNINTLCAGNYFATVTDANGCTLNSNPFAIIAPLPLVINTQSNTDVSCNGACNGTATFTVSGGTPGITVQWFDSPGNNPIGPGATMLNLCPGTYYAIATDANGCTIQSANQVITEPSPLTVIVDTIGTACGTNCSGIATATPSGGTPGYTYQWFDATTNSAIGQTTASATGLCAGDYYVIVTDANGCTIQSITVTILTNTIVDGTLSATNVNCNGYCNGVVDLTPNGGALPYTYIWFNQNTGLPIGQSTQDANGLCAGDYYVIVTDANLCSSVPLPVTVTQPTPAISAVINTTNVQCAGQCTGTAVAVVNGGTPPYTQTWVNALTGFPIGQTTLTASNLCAGSYELLVTDANGCMFTSNPVLITEPTPMAGTFSSTNIACNGQCNALATYAVGGGIPPYTFNWSSSGNTGSVESGLCAGSYTVSVSDNNGCTLGPNTFIVTEPTPFSASMVNGNVSCSGICDGVVSVNAIGGTGPYSYQWTDPSNQTTPVASGLCNGTFDVTIQDANGCNYGPFSATVSNSTAPTATASATNTTCNGLCDGTATANPSGGLPPYTYQWNDALFQTTQTANGLCPGNYTVIVTDANGCSTSAIVTTIAQPVAINVTLTPTNVACNGGCTGAVTSLVTGGTAPYTYFWNTADVTPNLTNVCPALYNVIVTDANGCQQTQAVTITESSTLTATFTTTVTACGACTGTATVSPSGGTPGYSYQWGPSAANQITQTATGLCAGAHQVTITDNNGCSVVLAAAVSNSTGELVAADSTSASCATACNGTASVLFTCSDAPCAIQWNDPGAQTTATATGLCPGTYIAVITNASGCVTARPVTVDGPNTLQANVSYTNVLCDGTCTGTGTSTPTGGTPPYSYVWNDPAAQITSTVFNLCVGAYQVSVTDSLGCTASGTVNIIAPSPLTFTTTVSNATCNNQCNGAGNAFPSGGTLPYTYQWDDPAAQNTENATGLCAGTYNVTVFDGNGCTSGPQTITITEPPAATLSISFTHPDCSGVCNGTATVSVAGGSPPYFYSWDDAFNQTTSTATNLCAGTYSVTVTDVAGCILGIETVTLSSPLPINIALTPQSPLCNGSCDGMITSVVSGGSPGYTMTWTPSGQTGTSAIGLCAGNYTLTVTDANGCMSAADTTLVNPLSLQANISVTNASCSGLCDGSASVTPSGGTGSLTTVWAPSNQTTSSVSALCAGNYSVSISDANGCSRNFPFSILEPAPLILLTGSSPSTCGGPCNGAASVGPSGGNPPYTYQWDAGAANQNTQAAVNLCAGIYDVTVTDALGCVATATAGVSDFAAETLTVNSIDATCPDICNGSVSTVSTCTNAPCTFQWFESDGTNMGINTSFAAALCPGDYFVQLTNSPGCITIQNFTIDSPDTLEITEAVAPPPCNGLCNTSISLNVTGGTPGYSFQWDAAAGGSTSPIVNNLCAGSYTVIVTDAVGCDDTLTYVFTAPPPLQVNISQNDVTCNGDCNGTATAWVTGGTPGYVFTWNDPSNQSTPVATGLCGGNYALVVTDASGCSVINGSVNITEPPLLTLSANGTAAICFNDCNGTATATINGGTTPYFITWNDPALQNTVTASGLCTGTYQVNVTDNNNCLAGPATVIIPEPTPVTFTAVTSDALCNGVCDGTITITASGGNGSYQYSVNNGVSYQSSNAFINLCPGSYTLLVIDGSGCTSVPQNVNINEPTTLTSNFTTFEPPCGLNSGAITALPIGGTPGYTFIWMDASSTPIGQTTQTAINLPSGIYSVLVTDVNGCQVTVPVTLSNSNAPNLTFTSTSPVCNGDCTGSIDITVTGGTPGYTYLWSPAGQTTEDLINQCAGTYLVQVSDVNACSRFQFITIAEPAALTSTFSSLSATCGTCNGSASVLASGGTGSLSYIWSNGQTGSAVNNLCAGAYTVQVTDANGCSNQFNTVIDNTGSPAVAVNITNESCNGTCNGAASANAFGGTAPYTFFWLHNGSSAASQNNLCAGTYLVQVSDSLGCVNTQSVTIAGPQPVTDSLVVVPAACGVCDGTATAFVTGGFPPFTYQWSAAAGGVTTQQATNLCQGLYSVIITDGLGCQDTASVILNNSVVPQLTLTVTDVDCNGNCNGTATAVITGNNPFTTVWQNAAGVSIGQTGTSATALCANNYIVQITDAANCILSTAFTVEQPDSILVSIPFVTDETCFNTCDGVVSSMPINGTLPLVYAWNDPGNQVTPIATALCDGVYTVTITDANGCTASMNATVNDPPAIVIVFDTTSATCSSVANGAIDATVSGGSGGFVYSWSGPNGFTSPNEDLINIFYGLYTLTVTDANGCTFTDSIDVNALLIAMANAGPDTSFCANGTPVNIIGTGTPGVTFQWFNGSGNVVSTSANLNTIPVLGINTFILETNINGCIGRDTVVVNYFPLPAANAGPDINIITGNSTSIGGSPTTAASNNVVWTPFTDLTDTSAFNPTASPDSTTMYTVTVTDANGCRATDSMWVIVLPDIIFPNGFSPNGDGDNDVWILDFISEFPEAEVEVFNRWGQPIFYSKGYDTPWNGTYNGEPVTVGTYYYIIKLNNVLYPNDFVGPLTILR